MSIRRFWIACLISAVLGLSLAVTPAFAAGTFSWDLSCRGSGDASAYWSWLQDGQSIVGSESHGDCIGNDKASGAGARPAAANGIFVQLRACTGWGCDYQSETVSFDASGSFNVSLQASGKWTADPCEGPHCSHMHLSKSYHEAATISMT